MIIDAHTHLFPETAYENPKGFGRERGEHFWTELVVPERGRSLQGWVGAGKMLLDMDEAGVEQCLLMGWYWEKLETCREHNRWYARQVSEHPGRWKAFASFHPGDVVAMREELSFVRDSGFVGLGELHPGVQGFSLRDPDWMEAASFACEHGLWVNLHVTEPVGRPYKPKAGTVFEDIQWMVERLPELKVMLSHWGGLLLFHELNPYVRERFRNVYYDTAASPLLYDPGVFALAIEAIGPEKILYGSDYPLKVYPRLQEQPDFHRFIDEIRDVVPDTRTLQMILGGNAERLFFDGRNG